jgi:hypothetical protein
VARATSRATELAFVGLSFVDVPADAQPASRAASIGPAADGGPAVQRWIEATLPEDVRALFRSDAPLLGSAMRDVHVAHGVSWFALLTDDELLRWRSRPLAELTSEGPPLRGLAQIASPATEIFWADLGLAFESFALVFDRDIAPRLEQLSGEFDRLVEEVSWVAPCTALGDTELSFALGAHGRVLGERVVVGVGDPATPSVLRAASKSLHEHAVRASAQALSLHGAAWAQVEAVALELGQRVARGTALEREHARWCEAVDRTGLEEPAELAEILDLALRKLNEVSATRSR